MHYLRIRLTRHSVFTCSYAVNFATYMAAIFILQSRHASRGRRWLIMDKDDEN